MRIAMPIIFKVVLPEVEQPFARALGLALEHLSSVHSSFDAAVKLCQHYHPRNQMMTAQQSTSSDDLLKSKWSALGARVGAFCLYDFYQITQSINSELLHKCPTIRPMINLEARKAAQKKFDLSFPDISRVRHAAAHLGEINSTPDKEATNRTKVVRFERPQLVAGFGDVTMVGTMLEDRYTFSSQGQSIGYEVTQESVAALGEVLGSWREAFLPVEWETGRLYYEKRP